MTAYYNEIDPFAAQWLRNLIAAGHIAPGDVDERSIVDVQPSDLEGYTQCHFFAGIGVWSYALRLAGWPDDRPVWTGSCPCQPFSAAGKQKGFNDERHLWPHLFRLISECKPPTVFGEQVARKAGLEWLDLVSTDLENENYAVGSAELGACSVGAPHIRQRLYWVADDQSQRRHGSEGPVGATGRDRTEEYSLAGGLGNAGGSGTGRHSGAVSCSKGASSREGSEPRDIGDECRDASTVGGLGQSDCERRTQHGLHVRERGPLEDLPQALRPSQGGSGSGAGESGRPVSGHWSGADWVLCRDPRGPRWRPVEPGTFSLAHGAPGRVGRLRAYGNAIVGPLAAEFVRAYLEAD